MDVVGGLYKQAILFKFSSQVFPVHQILLFGTGGITQESFFHQDPYPASSVRTELLCFIRDSCDGVSVLDAKVFIGVKTQRENRVEVIMVESVDFLIILRSLSL